MKKQKRPLFSARKPKRTKWKVALLLGMLLVMLVLSSGCAENASTTDSPFGGILGSRSDTVDIVLLLTALSFLPAMLIMLTSFTRTIIVLGFVRNAMGTQQMPPNQVLIGLALFLTFFVMQPIISDIDQNAYQPYDKQEISLDEALGRAETPLRGFMIRQTYEKDLETFVAMSKIEAPESLDDIPFHVIIPAFITSEMKRAFQMGFFIYIPFIVIDMVVASTLMAMGMMMLPPIMISLPFKVLLFVMVDGWMLVVQTIVVSFQNVGG